MGCGRVASQPELVRLAVVGRRVVADPERRVPGRGAYVCPRRACWEAARRRNAFQRAFRRPVDVPDDALNLTA